MTQIDNQCRAPLEASIRERDVIKRQLAGQQASLDRATSLVASLADSINQHDAIQATATSQSAAALAEQFRHGEAVLPNPSPSVAIVERLAIESRLKIAEQARDQLLRELIVQQSTLDAADEQVRQNALEVLRLEADRIAEIVEGHESELNKQRTVLRGLELAEYMLVKVQSDNQWVRPKLIRPRILIALQRPAEPQFAGGRDPASKCATQWKEYFETLTTDANAKFCG